VNAVFDPEAQCEPSDILYKFCFTDYDQRWVQMEALNLDHHALHEDPPIRPGLLSQISNRGDPRKTAVYDGTNIGGLCPGIQRQNEFPHWQLWIGTKNAVKNWHLLQDCRIKTVCNTMHRSQSLGQEVRCITLAGNMPPTSLTLCSLPILERAHVLPSQHNGHPCIVCAAARRSVKTNGFSAEWR
jgi:hypothetical protein